jgi:hypothetical protein
VRRTPPGFTLVEVLASIALSMLLLAALYQAMNSHTRYSETASRRISAPQIARVLLHQIADELRSVAPPLEPWQDPARARRLLDFGVVDLLNPDAAALSPTLNEEMSPRRDEPGPLGSAAERFGLLGTSDRLLMLCRRGASAESSIERYERDRSAALGASGEDERRLGPERWGDLRQVLYAPRPLPEALAARRAGLEVVQSDSIDAEEREFEPFFGGILRQEVSLVFSPDAQDEAFSQLAPHLFPESEELESPEEVLTASASEFGGDEPLPPRTTTAVIAPSVTAMRFRYHDGREWLGEWRRHDVLPRAVEISISFDPRAADPRWLAKYLEERGEAETSGEATPSTPLAGAASVEKIEAPLFPYRLVVALPAADRTPAPEFPPEEAPP